jgi:hypothetical protein
MQTLVLGIVERDTLQRHAGYLQQVVGGVGFGDAASQERCSCLGIVPVDARFSLEAGTELAVESVLICPDPGVVTGIGSQHPRELFDPIAQQVVRVLNRRPTQYAAGVQHDPELATARTIYRIVVRDELSEALATAFEVMEMEANCGLTILTREVKEQPHHHGILDRMRALGLESVTGEPNATAEAVTDDRSGGAKTTGVFWVLRSCKHQPATAMLQ